MKYTACKNISLLLVLATLAGPLAAQPVAGKWTAGIRQSAWKQAAAASARPQNWQQLPRTAAARTVRPTAVPVFKRGSKKPAKGWLNQLARYIWPFQPVRVGKDVFSSRKQLDRAVKQSYERVVKFQEQNFPSFAQVPFRQVIYRPFDAKDPLSLANNRTALYVNQKLRERMTWLERWPDRGRRELQAAYAAEAEARLVQQSQQVTLLLLGEKHDSLALQQAVVRLLKEIKQANPSRRVVLFSEFLDLPATARPAGAALPRYYRRVAEEPLPAVQAKQISFDQYADNVFRRVIADGVEVYPLEDPTQNQILDTELGEQMEFSWLTISSRNKTWARVMESKMAEIRRTDPDALFVVYAGLGHTSWIVPTSLPKFFASEHPVVVELSENRLSHYNMLYPVWGTEDTVFRQRASVTLLHWTGQYARALAKHVGFDYAFIVPGGNQ